MAEPKLATVDGQIIERILPDLPPGATEQQRANLAFFRSKGAQIAKEARADERRKQQPAIDQAVQVVTEADAKAYALALQAARDQFQEQAQHMMKAAAGRWFGVASVMWVIICAAMVFGVGEYTARAQANLVAAQRAANAPRGLQNSPEMQPQEGGGFR